MPQDDFSDDRPAPPAVSRRQFLKGVGVVGAAGALVPGLLERGDTAEAIHWARQTGSPFFLAVADRLEASGGVSLATVRAIAATGVDLISVGALTHSAPNFDVGLDAA